MDGAAREEARPSPAAEAAPNAAIVRRLNDPDRGAVLSWLSEGDPLRLEPRCALQLRKRRVLMDPELCFHRSLARTCLLGREFTSETPLDEWLEQRIDEAIRELLLEERIEHSKGVIPSEPLEPRLAYLRDVLAMEPAGTLEAAVKFHGLPFEDRDAFFALCIEGRSVEECLEAGMGPPELLRERTNRALDTINAARSLAPGYEE